VFLSALGPDICVTLPWIFLDRFPHSSPQPIQERIQKMPPKVYQQTYIPALDTQLDEIAKKPRREPRRDRNLPADFPGTPKRKARADAPSPARATPPGKPGKDADVVVIGAGWNFPKPATAFAAAGATQVAYEMRPEKTAKGQIGLTGKDDYFYLGQHREAQLMPDFTPDQLNRLPPVIRAIAELPSYQALTEKRKIADAIASGAERWKEKQDRYHALDKKLRISKQELIDAKMDVVKVLQEHGSLEIVPEEAGIDLVSSRLDSGKAVFMVSGKQVNLDKMGMRHLQGQSGFVQELLRGHHETEAAFDAILAKQREVIEWAAASNTPLEEVPLQRLPAVAIVGGADTARGNTLDVLERLNPQLLHLVSIRPLPKTQISPPTSALTAARDQMAYQSRSGYIKELNRSEDGKSIDALEIFNAETSNFETIKPDLLIHTADEYFSNDPRARTYEDANDSITEALQENPAANALLRRGSIVADGENVEIMLRITETFKFSLREDVELVNSIRALIEKHGNGEAPTVMVHGDNFFTKSVTLLAAEMGYRGNFLHLTAPTFPGERLQHKELEKKLQGVRLWRDITGRMVGEGTQRENGKFRLSVKDPAGQLLAIDNIDMVINATGKTKSTPLVEAMKEKGYVGTHLSDLGPALHTNHPHLSGWHNFFSPREREDVDSPTMELAPFSGHTRLVEPWGWDDAFEFGRSVTQHDSASSAVDRRPQEESTRLTEDPDRGGARSRHSLLGVRPKSVATSSKAAPVTTGVAAGGVIPSLNQPAVPVLKQRLAATTRAGDPVSQPDPSSGPDESSGTPEP
jgi:hypothetical protein